MADQRVKARAVLGLKNPRDSLWLAGVCPKAINRFRAKGHKATSPQNAGSSGNAALGGIQTSGHGVLMATGRNP
jgi:hypothetical protein